MKGTGLVAAARPRVHRVITWAYRHLRLIAPQRRGLRILLYHSIGGAPFGGDIDGVYSMSFDCFEEHIRYLATQFPNSLVPFNRPGAGGQLPKIGITFDDGYRDNLTVAAPLLVELRVPFAVFVCTAAVAERRRGFLSPEDVRELARLPGAQIGSHSISHARLTKCDDRSLDEELGGSKAYLEDLLGQGIDSIAYPYGAVDRRVRDAAARMGYRFGVSSRFDVNLPKRDPLLMCRTEVWATDDLPVFTEKLRGDWDWRRWRYQDPQETPS